MIRCTVSMLFILLLVGCNNSYTFDSTTWHAADNICSENKGVKSYVVSKYFYPSYKFGEGILGSIDMVKCNDGASYYNNGTKRYPSKYSPEEQNKLTLNGD